MGRLRRRLATWLDPTRAEVADQTRELPLVPSRAPDDDVWMGVARQFAHRVLAASYRMSADLGEAVVAEQDPDRLHRLYRLDHANTGVRRRAENLQVLAGARVDDAGRQVTTLLDVVRAAAAAVDDYPRVRVGPVTDLAVVEQAADDVIRILTELLDNATAFSPPQSTVSVATHLTEHGHVLVRIEDEGTGIDQTLLTRLNAALAGDRPLTLDPDNPGGRVGLLVVQRLALDHRLQISLVPRTPTGTTTAVLLPSALLCEKPAEPAPVDSGQSSVAGPIGPRSGTPLPPGPTRRMRPVSTLMPRRPAPEDFPIEAPVAGGAARGSAAVGSAEVPPLIVAVPIPPLPSRPAGRVPPPFSSQASASPLPVRHGQPVPLARDAPLSTVEPDGAARGSRSRVPASASAGRALMTASTFSDEVGDFADGVAHARADGTGHQHGTPEGVGQEQNFLETEGSGQ